MKGPAAKRARAAQLFDHRDGGDEIAALPAVFLVDREPADAERGELAEQLHREAVLAIPLAHALGRHLGRDEAPQRVAQQRDVLGLVGEVRHQEMGVPQVSAKAILSTGRRDTGPCPRSSG